MPHVSAVICTRNRADKIGNAVSSVLANEYPSFDADRHRPEHRRRTARALRPLPGEGQAPALRPHEPGRPVRGRTTKGFAGRRARSSPSRTTTASCPTDWLQSIADAFAANEDVDLVYGRVVPLERTRTTNAARRCQSIAQPERLSRRDGFRVFGMGANFAHAPTSVRRVGGFDEVLGGGGPLRSSQDFDLAYRTYRSGSVILLSPDVTLLHDGRREARGLARPPA